MNAKETKPRGVLAALSLGPGPEWWVHLYLNLPCASPPRPALRSGFSGHSPRPRALPPVLLCNVCTFCPEINMYILSCEMASSWRFFSPKPHPCVLCEPLEG